MIYETKRLILRPLNIKDTLLLNDFLKRNKEFLEPWEPKREESYFSINGAKKIIQNEKIIQDNKRGIKLYIFLKDEVQIIGQISLSNIIYGAFLSCHLSYKLDQKYTKKGYMSEALEKIIFIAFKELNLHRIEANVMPKNESSIKLLTKRGFENEGISKEYLKINGVWEDHFHFVLLNKN